MTRFSTSTRIEAPVEKTWEVLSDIGSIYKWNPGVAHSYSTSEESFGEGATRHCDIKSGPISGYLEERAFDWNEGKSFKIDIYESSLPLKSNIVEFTVSADGDGARVTVTPEYSLKFGPIGAIMDALMFRRQLKKGMDGLLAGLKYHVETGKEVGTEIPKAA